MANGVKFDNLHCLDDLGMYMQSKQIGLPDVQKTYIDVPGRNGPLDLTEALSGEVKYSSREITIDFNTTESICGETCSEFIRQVSSAIHGKRLRITFDEDPDYYYMGRCEMGTVTNEGGLISFTLTCTCDPFKYDEAGNEYL